MIWPRLRGTGPRACGPGDGGGTPARGVPALSAGIHPGKLVLDVVHGEAVQALPC
jgi:hypothetical protein